MLYSDEQKKDAINSALLEMNSLGVNIGFSLTHKEKLELIKTFSREVYAVHVTMGNMTELVSSIFDEWNYGQIK